VPELWRYPEPVHPPVCPPDPEPIIQGETNGEIIPTDLENPTPEPEPPPISPPAETGQPAPAPTPTPASDNQPVHVPSVALLDPIEKHSDIILVTSNIPAVSSPVFEDFGTSIPTPSLDLRHFLKMAARASRFPLVVLRSAFNTMDTAGEFLSMSRIDAQFMASAHNTLQREGATSSALDRPVMRSTSSRTPGQHDSE